MSFEGELLVALQVDGDRVVRARIALNRTDVGRLMLQQRTRPEIAATVPMQFTAGGLSQAAASGLACAAAAGEAVTPGLLAQFGAAVNTESIRESVWHALVDWPAWIGEHPGATALAAAQGTLAFWLGAWAGRGAGAMADALAIPVLGMTAEQWLALDTLDDLDRWLDAGRTPAARLLRRLRDDDAASLRSATLPEPPLLAVPRGADWITELSRAMDADPEFARLPTWHGVPAETGPLARLQADPLIGRVLQRSRARMPARFVAQLRELALRLTGQGPAAVGALALPQGGGIAWVEALHGLLVHRVSFIGGRAWLYRIVTGPDWNFHPQGALAAALAGLCATDARTVETLALQCAHSLDPGVCCRVTVERP